jgi:erythromycin esterase
MVVAAGSKMELWQEQIRKTAYNITNRNDFSAIDEYVKDKRIVLLGENSHGMGEFYTTKIDVIRYLHEHHGFNIVALESSLMEATLCKELLGGYAPDEQIQNGLLNVFHNEEMLPLFQEEWAQSLQISGMDPQSSYPLLSKKVLEWIERHTDEELSEAIKAVETRYFEINHDMIFNKTNQLKQTMKVLVKEYENLLPVIDRKLETYNDHERQRILQVIRRGMQNRMEWLQLELKGSLSSSVERDLRMFENVEWLMNHYYKGEKIIVWAHNFHIRKERTLMSKLFGIKALGYHLHQKYPEDIYSIGLYAGSGSFSAQFRVEFEVGPIKKNNLELLLYKAFSSDVFLPLNVETEKSSWSNRKWDLLESGFGRFKRICVHPGEHYDAILFIREVSPPCYLERAKDVEEK